MNNKGFTLVELLAVIVLLAVIGTLAVPSIMGISLKTKKTMLDTKKDLIKENAKLYGQENLSEVVESTKKLRKNSVNQGYECITLTVKDLYDEGYLTGDKDDEEAGYILNPVDNSNMNSLKVIIYYKNKRVAAVFEEETVVESGAEITNTYICQ
ncbi:MAG: prepilin-type N-terminal cleavage/methylation domain-containing protein [Bacilli bacterium]|nr:prepilin-type N-terminal cleavage/methylation domain-containing protein [Bacilli bacterium]